MSDRELEAIKERKLKELLKRATAREQKKEQVDVYQILNKVFKGRAPANLSMICPKQIVFFLQQHLNRLDLGPWG